MPKKKALKSSKGVIKYKALACSVCGIDQDVHEEVKKVTCWKCVQRGVEPPRGFIPYDPNTRTFKGVNPNIKRPRGWKFMAEFVDSEGNVFKRGVEQPKLKNTLEPTKIKKSKKTKKQENRDDILKEISDLKKQLKQVKDKKKLAGIRRRLTNLEKKVL